MGMGTTRLQFVLMAILGGSITITPARGDEVRTTTLTCGTTRFTMTTHSVQNYVTRQGMWARPSGGRLVRKVDLRQPTFMLRRVRPGLAVVAGEISLWGCATTPKAHVLILYYDCSQILPTKPPARFCSKSGEWYRYIAMDGTLLDKGFGLGFDSSDADPREGKLRFRLGLSPDDEDVDFQQTW